LYVPTLSNDLVLKTILIELLSINSSVVSVLMHNLLCHLTQWLELNRNAFCYKKSVGWFIVCLCRCVREHYWEWTCN